jgi:hypothetical protein
MVVHFIKIIVGRKRKEEREEHEELFRRPLVTDACSLPEEYGFFL